MTLQEPPGAMAGARESSEFVSYAEAARRLDPPVNPVFPFRRATPPLS